MIFPRVLHNKHFQIKVIQYKSFLNLFKRKVLDIFKNSIYNKLFAVKKCGLQEHFCRDRMLYLNKIIKCIIKFPHGRYYTFISATKHKET